MQDTESFKTAVEAAVAFLIGKGIIKKDIDVVNALRMSKGTFSAYKSGKTPPSENFIQKFENYYGIRLADFALQQEMKRYDRFEKKMAISKASEANVEEGVPVYDVPIDASFIERYRDERYEPLYFVDIPKLRNCNFGAIVSGNSMYPVMKSGTIAICRIVEDLNYFDPGEMYFLSTTNGFETVKYVQPGEHPDELLLIPHNEKIKPTTIKKDMVIKMCIVEAWINFR